MNKGDGAMNKGDGAMNKGLHEVKMIGPRMTCRGCDFHMSGSESATGLETHKCALCREGGSLESCKGHKLKDIGRYEWSSAKEIAHAGELIVAPEWCPMTTFTDDGWAISPLQAAANLESSLRCLHGFLFDTEVLASGKSRLGFFERPQKSRMEWTNDIKTENDTNMTKPCELPVPNRFALREMRIAILNVHGTEQTYRQWAEIVFGGRLSLRCLGDRIHFEAKLSDIISKDWTPITPSACPDFLFLPGEAFRWELTWNNPVVTDFPILIRLTMGGLNYTQV